MNYKPKPIRRDDVRRSGYMRIPARGSMIPRLQPEEAKTEAIGFVVHSEQQSED